MTDTLVEIDFTDGDQRGMDLLPDFLKEAPNLKEFVNAFAAEFQELYDAVRDVYVNSVLDNAYGRTLDQCGERVDLARTPGQSDDEYRAAIKVQIQKTATHGAISQLIDLMNVMVGTEQALLDEVFPCSIVLNAVVPELSAVDEESIAEKMNTARAAGVRLDLGLTQKTDAFQFSTEENDSVPEGTGFSSLADDSDGGQLDMYIG